MSPIQFTVSSFEQYDKSTKYFSNFNDLLLENENNNDTGVHIFQEVKFIWSQRMIFIDCVALWLENEQKVSC